MLDKKLLMRKKAAGLGGILDNPNLKLFLTMDNVDAGNVYDDSTFANDFVRSGGTIQAGVIGNSIKLNVSGSSERLSNTTDVADFTTSTGSIFAFVKRISGQTARLFTVTDVATQTNFVTFGYIGGGQLIFQVKKGGSTLLDIRSTETLTTATNQSIAIHSNGSTIKMYIDKVEVTYNVVTGSNTGQWYDEPNNPDLLEVGAVTELSTTYTQIEVDELTIFPGYTFLQADIDELHDRGL